MKYLEFYYKCMETGVLPEYGLCISLPESSIDCFEPTESDLKILLDEDLSASYWAAGIPRNPYTWSHWDSFTPLRQNIVLFMAAMNNEL